RIVFQPLDFTGGSANAVDGAVHAYYSFTADDFAELVRAVIALRQQQTGPAELGPLAVHPTLAAQGLLGAQAKGLHDIVLQRAGKANFVKFATMTPDDQDTRWDFRLFIIQGESFTPYVIPQLPAGTTSVSLYAGPGPELAYAFSPETTSPTDNMQLLADFEK